MVVRGGGGGSGGGGCSAGEGRPLLTGRPRRHAVVTGAEKGRHVLAAAAAATSSASSSALRFARVEATARPGVVTPRSSERTGMVRPWSTLPPFCVRGATQPTRWRIWITLTFWMSCQIWTPRKARKKLTAISAPCRSKYSHSK